MSDAVERLLALAKVVTIDGVSPVPSPCISVCRMDSGTGLCEGCFRTLDEIVAWSKLSDEGDNGKRRMWINIGQRASLALA